MREVASMCVRARREAPRGASRSSSSSAAGPLDVAGMVRCTSSSPRAPSSSPSAATSPADPGATAGVSTTTSAWLERARDVRARLVGGVDGLDADAVRREQSGQLGAPVGSAQGDAHDGQVAAGRVRGGEARARERLAGAAGPDECE